MKKSLRKFFRSSPSAGFTLIEFMLYTGISAIVLFSTVIFSRTVVQSQVKQKQLSEVRYHGNFALEQMLFTGKRASTMNPQTVYNTHPGILAFTVSSTTVLIDTYTKTVSLNGTNLTIRKLRLKQGNNPAYDLTSDAVHVSHFFLINLSHTNASSIKIYLTLEALNPSNSKAYEAKQSWNTTVTLRQ